MRKFDIHTGVDLYCPEGELVRASETGTVVRVEPFTGPQAESPWWEETYAVVVRSTGFWTVLYGELMLKDLPRIGDIVKPGQPIGRVGRVLRHDKGLPTTMLHFEMYDSNVRLPVWWLHGDKRPEGLLDPTELLVAARGTK